MNPRFPKLLVLLAALCLPVAGCLWPGEFDAAVDAGGHADTDAQDAEPGDTALDTAPPCSNGESLCASGCVDLETDRQHCGACGVACSDGPCLGGRCSGIAQLAASQTHTCARTEAGELWCWGANAYGQLGDGTHTPANTPVRVTLLEAPATAVAVGNHFTCALSDDGTAGCWGFNDDLRLGALEPEQPGGALHRVDVSEPLVALTAGFAHACALTAHGAAWCWGRNGNGAVDGVPTATSAPVQVEVGEPVGDIVAGPAHTCALGAEQGTVWCWGANDYGQLGPGAGAVPRVWPGSTGTRGVALGRTFTCALQAGRVMTCLGDDSRAPLAGRPATFAVPTEDGAAVRALSAGPDHLCALSDSGALYCWGGNYDGQAVPLALDPIEAPTRVLSGRVVVDVATSGFHTCLLLDDAAARREVYCYGAPGQGRLGIGERMATLPTLQMTPVPLDGPVTWIAAGAHHACALHDADGVPALSCWGRNRDGEGKPGAPSARPAVAMQDASNLRVVEAGPARTCFAVGAFVECYGSPIAGSNSFSFAAPVEQIAVGTSHLCALGQGRVECVGNGRWLGVAGTLAIPVQPAELASLSVVDVAVGPRHTCFVTDTGAVYCGGDNERGQLGREPLENTPPSAVELPGVALEVAAGNAHTCAVLATGDAFCWGANRFGQLGLGTASELEPTPRPVPLGRPVSSVEANGDTTCAVTSERQVLCWGANTAHSAGQPGHEPVLAPAVVPLEAPTALRMGNAFACAIRSTDAQAVCFGSREGGRLGDDAPLQDAGVVVFQEALP